MQLARFAPRLAVALALTTLAPPAITAARADEVVALVPAYFYPTWWSGSPWDQLNAAAALIPVEAIMNPDSGPGDAANPDYQYAVAQLQAAGGKVIGYVPTGYGARAAADILADVADYMAWYGVDGVFLDEMGNSSGPLDYVGLYAAIQDLAAESGVGLHVVGNAGIPFAQAEAYMAATDTLVIFEGPLTNGDPEGASFQAYPDGGPYAGLSAWWLSYGPSRVANLVYSAGAPMAMLGAAINAIGDGAGYIYITDAGLPNPWDTLPSYWDDEVWLIELIDGGL
jgi:hypothetical protein